jgi:hypothetical protein
MEFENINEYADMLAFVKENTPEKVAERIVQMKAECENKIKSCAKTLKQRKKLGELYGKMALSVVEDVVSFHDDLIEHGVDPNGEEMVELRETLQRLGTALKVSK